MNSHALGTTNGLHLGKVTANDDPENRGRVKVALLSVPMEVWAAVVAPSAGQGYGASFVPRLDEIVVMAFVGPEVPLVLGSVWAGTDSRPENAVPQQKHYVVRTPAATVLDFDDSGPKVKLTTKSGYHVTIDDSGSGEIVVERGAQSVKLGAAGIDVKTSGSVNVDAATVKIQAATVTVNAALSKFSGVVQADTVIATAVVGTTYTPGAGNIL